MPQHRWQYNDDVLVLYLHLYGDDAPITRKKVAAHIGFTDVGSVRMRIQNFQAVDGQDGLCNYARLTKRVYDEYRNINREQHRNECLRIMQT